MTVTHQSDEFIENLVSKITELTHHNSNAKQQANIFESQKKICNQKNV
jgi:hypothetical protein